MGVKVLSNGVDITQYCDLPSLQIQEDILNDQWELDVNITIPPSQRPRVNTRIQVLNGSTTEFAGTWVTNPEYMVDPITFRYEATANNYQQWFDRHLVAEFYPQQNADAIVKSVVNAYCPGFTTNHVQAAPVVPPQNLDYTEPSAGIKNIANLLAWSFYIDYEMDVHFYLSESIQSPLPDNTLDVDTDLDNYGDLVLEENGAQVKNRIVAKEFYIMSQEQVPLYFVADGQNNTFTLPQIPAGTSAQYITVEVGGLIYTPKADVVDGMPGVPGPSQNDYAYINVQNRTVRFDFTPAQGTIISGSMYYKYQPVYVQDDPNLIQEQAALEGTDGVYEYAVSDPRMSGDDTSLAQARTAYLLAKYGTPNLTGTLVSYLQGWRAGQSFRLKSDIRMGGVDQTMYVAQCTKTVVSHPDGGEPIFKYQLTISDRPFIF